MKNAFIQTEEIIVDERLIDFINDMVLDCSKFPNSGKSQPENLSKKFVYSLQEAEVGYYVVGRLCMDDYILTKERITRKTLSGFDSNLKVYRGYMNIKIPSIFISPENLKSLMTNHLWVEYELQSSSFRDMDKWKNPIHYKNPKEAIDDCISELKNFSPATRKRAIGIIKKRLEQENKIILALTNQVTETKERVAVLNRLISEGE